MINTLIFLGLSGFLIWFIQSQKIFDYIFRGKFLKEIRDCQVCLGTWVCLVLFPIFHLIIFENWYQYIVMWIIFAAISSFIIHLIRLGWTSRFGITTIK